MSKPLRFRDRTAEQKVVDEANRHMEMMFGPNRIAKGRPPMSPPSYLPKKRVPRGAGSGAHDIDAVHRKQKNSDVEAPVIEAIGDLLREHRSVILAIRQNSGSAVRDTAYVTFFRILKAHGPDSMHGYDYTVPDFWGLLSSGRFYAVEAKKPSWTKPTNDREFKQAAFLALVRKSGNIGIFATSAEQVAEVLK